MSDFKFSVGPWNVHTGADSYGPETRGPIDLESKFARFAERGIATSLDLAAAWRGVLWTWGVRPC